MEFETKNCMNCLHGWTSPINESESRCLNEKNENFGRVLNSYKERECCTKYFVEKSEDIK